MNRQEHLLTIGIEECCEVAHRLSKALRFGMEEIQPVGDGLHPDGGNPEGFTNRERIRREVADLFSVLRMLDLDEMPSEWLDAKTAKIERFLAYSRTVGTLKAEARGSEPT